MNKLDVAIQIRRWRRELMKLSDRSYLKWNTRGYSERLPDFLIIGAMKSGTTALHQCLAQHPDIFMTHVKEPSYFLKGAPWLMRNPHVDSPEDLLRLMFRGYSEQKRVGESSTAYSGAPTLGTEAPANIYSESPGMQFIYVVRNPFARIVSHYLHCVELGIYSEPMVDVLKCDATFLERSLYHYQLARYLKYFERERFLVLFFEEFIKNPSKAIQQVCHFLGVSEGSVKGISTKQRNKTLVSSSVRNENVLFDKSSYDTLIGPIQEDVRELAEFIDHDIDFWDLSEATWCRGVW